MAKSSRQAHTSGRINLVRFSSLFCRNARFTHPSASQRPFSPASQHTTRGLPKSAAAGHQHHAPPSCNRSTFLSSIRPALLSPACSPLRPNTGLGTASFTTCRMSGARRRLPGALPGRRVPNHPASPGRKCRPADAPRQPLARVPVAVPAHIVRAAHPFGVRSRAKVLLEHSVLVPQTFSNLFLARFVSPGYDRKTERSAIRQTLP